MKKLVMICSLMLFSMLAFTQSITVDKKDLPPDLVKKIESAQQVQEVTQKLEAVNEWAGIGKEIGGAVREGLTAVKDVAVDFSKTDVGTFTMVLIAWKVVGQDMLGLGVGLIVLFIGVTFITWSYRRTVLSRRILVKDEGWFKAKTYEIVHSRYDNTGEYGFVQLVHGIALFALIGISIATIF